MRIFTISCKVGELMEKLRKNLILFEFLIREYQKKAI